MNVTDPVLWVGEALLNSEVELMENLADEQGAVGGRLQDGGEKLRQVRLQEAGALLNNIRLRLLTVQTCTPIITKDPGKMTFTNHKKDMKVGVINFFYLSYPASFSSTLLGSNSTYFFSSKIRFIIGPRSLCRYCIPATCRERTKTKVPLCNIAYNHIMKTAGIKQNSRRIKLE